MSITEWEIKGPEFANCNCAYGCPCQFNALPTDGTCRALGIVRIDEGHYGDIRLDGLHAGFLIDFPGAIHQGNGTHQVIVDQRASPEQRQALINIIRGEDTAEMATHFYVYAAMSTNHLEPLVAPIEFEIDIEARTARVKVGEVIEASCEPIRNPVTGDQHRARIDLPDGFEYTLAEMGSGSTEARGELPLSLKDSYGQLANIHLSHAGIVR